MPTLRFIQVTSKEPITATNVVTQIHYLFTPGEAPNPDATFWDLTIGGLEISGDDSENIHLLTNERVSELSNELQAQSWAALEDTAKSNYDMVPGWHEGLRPDFEKLRDFFATASAQGCAVLRVSSKDGFWYR